MRQTHIVAPAKRAVDNHALWRDSVLTIGSLPAVCLIGIYLSTTAAAVEVPAGTAISVRQQVSIGTRFSRVGDRVSAVLLAPALDQDRVVLPAGSELDGVLTMVRRMGLGFRHATASMAIDFRTIHLPGGKAIPIGVRLKCVENAREWVGADGVIHGIRPVTNASSGLAVAAWRLLVVAPGVGASVWATKLIFAPAPDTEIAFAKGTEYRLELVRPLEVEDAEVAGSGLPTRPLGADIRNETRAANDALPSQRTGMVSGEPADLVNLVLVGPASGVTRAFQAAGWSPSDPKAAGSIVRSYFSIMLRRGYGKAPMATMLLDGDRSDIELEKSLNTFARRHHVRIWRRVETMQGETVWVGAATEDTGIKFSRRARNFAHVIDGNVDAERTKVVNDLLYTGCVSEAGLVGRDGLPADLENGTGTRLKTDGRFAALRIGECAEPRVMPGVGVSGRTGVLRFLGGSLHRELVQSNFISIAYNGVRLTSSARRSLFGKPLPDDTGAMLTSQQVGWLAEKGR